MIQEIAVTGIAWWACLAIIILVVMMSIGALSLIFSTPKIPADFEDPYKPKE